MKHLLFCFAFCSALLISHGSSAAAYPGDEVKISRQAFMCRAVPYLAELELLQRRGNKVAIERYLNNGRCKQSRSTTKAVVIKYGSEEGRADFVKVQVRKREFWVRHSDLK